MGQIIPLIKGCAGEKHNDIQNASKLKAFGRYSLGEGND